MRRELIGVWVRSASLGKLRFFEEGLGSAKTCTAPKAKRYLHCFGYGQFDLKKLGICRVRSIRITQPRGCITYDNPQKMMFALARAQQCPPDSDMFAQISQETRASSTLYLFLQGASQV